MITNYLLKDDAAEALVTIIISILFPNNKKLTLNE